MQAIFRQRTEAGESVGAENIMRREPFEFSVRATAPSEIVRLSAEDYLAAAGHSGTVTVNGNQVTVTVSITQPMQILSIGGIDHLTVTGTGTATAEQNGGP